jgi:hypothetical protein
LRDFKVTGQFGLFSQSGEHCRLAIDSLTSSRQPADYSSTG